MIFMYKSILLVWFCIFHIGYCLWVDSLGRADAWVHVAHNWDLHERTMGSLFDIG